MKKKKTVKKSVTEIVVKVQTPPALKESDLEPIKDGGKFMIPKTWMSEKQVLKMVQKTPPKYVYERPAKGGGKWNYVTGAYVEKVLNYVFGWNWDFEVTSHGKEGDQLWVLGKLTVKDDRGHSITKSQFGRADVKFKKGTQSPLDYGNDLKAATTDALKKCASLLGIASDIYGKMELKQEAGVEVDAPKLPDVHVPSSVIKKEGQIIGPDGKPTWACENCKDPISDEVANYSLKMFKKRLCREHQPKK